MKRNHIILTLLITLGLLLLAGCGGGFDPYKALEVSNKDVKPYELHTEAPSSQGDQKVIFAGADINSLTEQEAKQMVAHYVDQHKNDQDVIILYLDTDTVRYVGEYNSTEQAYQASPTMEKAKQPDQFPAIFFTKTDK